VAGEQVSHSAVDALDGDETRRRDGHLTTGDMARLSGNTLRTVRFYEEAQLLEPEYRTDGGHRLFSPSQLERLCLISNLRVSGLSLEAIRDLLQAKDSASCGSEAAKVTLDVLTTQIDAMRERLAIMQRLLNELEEARATLAQCATCARPDLFPDECRQCEVMQVKEALSASLKVLWGVERT